MGRLNRLALAPGSASTLYAGAPAGGLWRSTDSGSTWTPRTDGLPLLGVTGIAVDPAAPATIYLLTGDGDGHDLPSIGVLKTRDGGTTWEPTALVWGPSELVYAYQLAMSPADPRALFAVTTLGIFRTTDGGVSWTNVLAGQQRDLEIKPGAPSTIYASGKHAVYRSTDGGDSFTLRSDSPNLLGLSPTGADDRSQAGYDLALAVDPADAETVYLGGVNTWKSTDGGQTWSITSYWVASSSSYGFTHADIHQLSVSGGSLYATSDGGLFLSTDGAASWSSRAQGLQITQPYRLCGTSQDSQLLYLGAQDNGTDRVEPWDGVEEKQRTMTLVSGGDGGQCLIDPGDSDTVYAESQRGALKKSTDGGASFTHIHPSGAGDGAWVMPYTMSPSDSSTLYAGYADVWKTTDGGTTWGNLSGGKVGAYPATRLAVVASANSEIFYLVKTGQKSGLPNTPDVLYRSADGGASWDDRTAGLPVAGARLSDLAVSSTDADRIWVTFSGG